MEASGQLCERCKRIDLDTALNPSQDLPTNGRMIMSLEEITNELKTSTCPLCCLFASIYVPLQRENKYLNRGHHLRAFKISSLGSQSQKKEKIKKKTALDPLVVLGVLPGRDGSILYMEDSVECLNYGVIAPIVTSDCGNQQKQSSEAHLVEPAKPNYARIQKWLDYCKEHHREVCNIVSGDIPVPLMCIDCSTRNIVQLIEGGEYYALSYVWGDKMLTTLSSEHRGPFKTLPSSTVAPVIEDAILAVQSLGGRYLWVDKYCINQEDDHEKHLLIKHMDRIYEGACATIIAVTDKNSDASLPGVGSCARKSQASCVLGDLHLVSTLPHISSPLKRSAWITRGWTYQEAILSKRCLFFTDEQVYFVCRVMNCCEALDILPTKDDFSTNKPGLLSTEIFDPNEIYKQGYEGAKIRREGLWSFFEHLSRYRARDLTFESDSLNAFQGIISKFSYRTVWGIPIATSSTLDSVDDTFYNMAFARGLCWRKVHYFKAEADGRWLRRVPDFPSWSWAGWIGPISSVYAENSSDYEVDSKCNSIESSTFEMQFMLGLEDGGLLSLREFYHSSVDTSDRFKLSHTLFCAGLIVQVRLQRPDSARATFKDRRVCAYVCPCHPTELHQGGAFTDYSAASVKFNENPTENHDLSTRIFDQLWDCVMLFQEKREWGEEPRGSYRLMVIDRDGDVARRVGDIDMEVDIFQRLVKTKQTIKLV
jgi:hypothetical protein